MNILIFGNGTLSLAHQERKICVKFAELGHKVYLLCNVQRKLFDVGELPSHPNLIILDIPAEKYNYKELEINDEIDVVLGMDQSVCPFVADYKRITHKKAFCIFLDLPIHCIDGKDPVNYNFEYAQRYYYWLTCGLELDSIIFNNSVAVEEFKRLYNRDSKLVWYPVVDDDYLNLYIVNKSDYVVGCNRLVPYKGTSLLVDALRRLPYRYKHISVSGDIKKFVQVTSQILGKDRFSLIYQASEQDKMQIIADAYLIVYPQITEWVGGMSILEGMSVKTPGVCFDYSVLRELYDDCVLYVRKKSVTDMREQIKKLYEDKDLYLDLQIRGYERFKKYFMRKVMIENLLKVMNG